MPTSLNMMYHHSRDSKFVCNKENNLLCDLVLYFKIVFNLILQAFSKKHQIICIKHLSLNNVFYNHYDKKT